MKEIIERIKRLKELYPEKIQFFPLPKERYIKGILYKEPQDIDYFANTEEQLSFKLDPQIKELYTNFPNGIRIASYLVFQIKTKKRYELADTNLIIWEQKPHLKHKFIAFMGGMLGGPDYGYVLDEIGEEPKVAIMKNPMDYEYELVGDYQVIAPTISVFFNTFLDKAGHKIEALIKDDDIIDMPEWES